MSNSKKRKGKGKRKKTVSKSNIRTLKVYPFLVNRSNYKYKEVPYIRLRGVWLQDAGFSTNDTINVVVLDELLVIRPAKEEQTDNDK